MIRLAIGETKTLRFELVDEAGAALDISGYSAVKFGLAKVAGGTRVVSRAAPGAGITVASNPAVVDVTLTDQESGALTPGRYVADVWVTLNGQKIASERLVEVLIERGVAQ
jgi:hypothetical protein